jgi:hypothetical protein
VDRTGRQKTRTVKAPTQIERQMKAAQLASSFAATFTYENEAIRRCRDLAESCAEIRNERLRCIHRQISVLANSCQSN